MAKKYTSEKYQDILENAKDQFKEICEFEGSERDLMEDDKAFGLGENDAQWLEDDLDSRKSSHKSYLTIMRSNQFTDHVKNQQRQNKPGIKISPEDDGATEEIAKINQGVIRGIQYESKAQQARQAGFDDAVDEGRGHWIVRSEYISGTFRQKIIIEPIPEARSVFMDIRRKKPDYSDCKYGFVVKPIRREEFEEKYPDVSIDNWKGEDAKLWLSDKDVMVADYYCEKYKKRKLIEIQEGEETRVLFEDELKEEISEDKIINSRWVDDPYWMWYKMCGNQILDDEKLPWKSIPIITVIGKETVINGEWSCKGLIRDIKQPLRLYNFLCSNEADIIAKAPRVPWVGAEGQFEGHEDEFADSNVADVPYLEYKPVTIGGQLAPPPQRAQHSVDLHNIIQQKQWIIEDIKAITGIYDASIGNRSNETSGVAIRMREAQGDNANFHFVDNYAMAIAYEGRLINDALGVIYDTPRTVTIRGEDDEEYKQEINTEDSNRIGIGNFNVTVEVGPSFNTRRQEQAAGMMEMFRGVGVVQEAAPDLVVRAQDWNGKDLLADRLEFATEMKYPGITTQTKPQGKDEEVDFLNQQLNQAKQQLNQIAQEAQGLQEALQKADADKQAAEAGKIQVELQKLDIERQRVMIEEQKVKTELMLKEREIELDAMKADLDSETKLVMNKNDNEVKLIQQTQQPAQVEAPKEDNSKEIKEIKTLIEKKPEKKTITVTKQDNGKIVVDSEVK